MAALYQPDNKKNGPGSTWNPGPQFNQQERVGSAFVSKCIQQQKDVIDIGLIVVIDITVRSTPR